MVVVTKTGILRYFTNLTSGLAPKPNQNTNTVLSQHKDKERNGMFQHILFVGMQLPTVILMIGVGHFGDGKCVFTEG